jgi:hypothetical protein
LEHEIRGTVALGALHQRVTFRSEPWPFYVLALDSGEVFLARRLPALYDRGAQPVAPREIPAGSVVRVRYCEEGGMRWMNAVQIVRLCEDQSPFDPVVEDDAG